MPQLRKVLAQVEMTANTSTDIYTVPDGTEAEVVVVICNRTNGAQSFRLSLAVAGATLDTKQYLYFDTSIAANDSKVADIGIRLQARDVVRAYVSDTAMTVSALGSEFT